jgi:uncharacterized cupredoxin-like copper-binding protein
MKKAILVLVFVLSISLLSVYFGTMQAQAQTQYNIYAGEINSSTYGFGNSATTITSPGPTLTFTAGETVTVTLHNAGTMDHNWAIVNSKSSTATVLWNAQVQSPSNPVAPGSTGSVTFTVGSAGNYYYICQVDGHVALGMWGNVVVQSAVPEFPAPLLIVFLAVAVTASAAYLSRINMKHPRPL